MCAPAVVPIAAATGLIASQRSRSKKKKPTPAPKASSDLSFETVYGRVQDDPNFSVKPKTTPKPTPAPKPVAKAAPKPAPKPVVKAPAPTPVAKAPAPKPTPVTRPTPTPVAKPVAPTPPPEPVTRQTATTMAKAPVEQAAVPEQKKRRFSKTRGLIGGRRRGTSSLRIASRGTSNLNY